MQRAVDEEEKARKRELELQAAQRERERPFRRVARCITARAYAMTRPQFGFQKNKGAFLPWLEGAAADSEAVPPLGALHFPVMLFYPEASPYHDTIEDVCEADTIGDHLDAVCPPSSCVSACADDFLPPAPLVRSCLAWRAVLGLEPFVLIRHRVNTAKPRVCHAAAAHCVRAVVGCSVVQRPRGSLTVRPLPRPLRPPCCGPIPSRSASRPHAVHQLGTACLATVASSGAARFPKNRHFRG